MKYTLVLFIVVIATSVVKAADQKPMASGCYFDSFPMDFVFLSTGKARIGADYMVDKALTGVYFVCFYTYKNIVGDTYSNITEMKWDINSAYVFGYNEEGLKSIGNEGLKINQTIFLSDVSNKTLYNSLYQTADAMDERTIKIYVEGDQCILSERVKGVVYTSTEFPKDIPDAPTSNKKPMESGCLFDSYPMDFVFLKTNRARVAADYMTGGKATGVYFVCEYTYVNKKADTYSNITELKWMIDSAYVYGYNDEALKLIGNSGLKINETILLKDISNKDLYDKIYMTADGMDERTISVYVEGTTCVMSERVKGEVYDLTEFPSNIPPQPSVSNSYFSLITLLLITMIFVMF